MLNQPPINRNKYWTSYIPLTNIGILIFSLFLFLAVDTVMVFNERDLLFFWVAMLAALLLFALFYYYENIRLRAKYESSTSRLDPYLLALVVLRDIAFLLNVIPFIQLAGWVALIFGSVPYLIVYFLLLHFRAKTVASSSLV